MTKSPVQLYLTNCKSFYSCIYCHTHLANHDELVSRSFQGINGRAYLFNSVINVICCPVVQRELNTGSHAVADIFCVECETILGWKYEKAYVETQKYKEGKYIIEMAHVVRENRHLELDKGKLFFGQQQQKSSSHSYGRSVVRRYYSSLTPGNMSCPTATGIASSNEEVDADEEELMFPFYDDLCAGQSSYTNSGLNRMRRSLYLDSTPYDWKHSATSSSSPSDRWPTGSSLATHNQLSSSVTKIASQQQVALASSLGSSDLSPSTSSSSSASTPPDVRTTTHNSLRTNSSNHPNDHGDTLCNLICNLDANAVSDANEEEETQFKFETEDPVIPSYSSKWESSVAAFNELYLKVSQRKLHLDESGSKEDAEYGIMLQKLRNIYATLERQHKADEPLHDIKVLRGMMRTIIRDNDNDNNNSTTTTSGENNTPSRDSSVSLDDEEFFDCCTDHEISNSATNCGSNTSSSSTVGTTRNNTTITND